MDAAVSMDLPNWMSKLPTSVLDKSLSEIAIPGTHNSFSYTLDPTSELGPTIPDTVKSLGNFAKGVVYKWCVTQSQTFTEQLESGIRYFDLRVASRAGYPDVFFVHGLYGAKVEPCLEEINSFLDGHSKEIVLLDFNHFYEMTDDHHSKLIDTVCRVFGNKLCMFVGVENVTLNMMWENGLQVIVLYQQKVYEDNPSLWSGFSCIRAPWAETTDLQKLFQFLEDKYLQDREQRFHVCQGVLTANTMFILGHFNGSLKKDFAMKVFPKYLSWLENKRPGTAGINICMADFTDISESEFVKCVIKLNY